MSYFDTELDALVKTDVLGYCFPEGILERVAKQNLWSEDYTRRVGEEYLKFMYMAIRHHVVPSLEVDEIWHAHLLFSRHYNTFCNQVLFKNIHHGPSITTSAKVDDVAIYENTKRLYFMYFSKEVPEDIWPSSEVRFRNVHFTNIDLLTHWVFPAGDWKACIKVLLKHVFLKFKLW